MIQVNAPMALEGAGNVRELGGYPALGGRRTRRGVFLRADSLHALTAGDKAKLYQYGVRTVVDLRSQREVNSAPGGLEDYRDVRTWHVPLLDQIQSQGLQEGLPPLPDVFPDSLGALYAQLLEEDGASLALAVRHLARAPGCALFHCTAGKDRTGVVAMLLLALCEVPRQVIVADYAATAANIKHLAVAQQAKLAAAGIQAPDFLFTSEAVEMERTLNLLESRYGGARRYLTAAGLVEADAGAVTGKLLE